MLFFFSRKIFNAYNEQKGDIIMANFLSGFWTPSMIMTTVMMMASMAAFIAAMVYLNDDEEKDSE